MRILSVTAPGNGSGKTTALAAILGGFPGRLTAVKFTTVFRDGVNCPRTEKSCACGELHSDFTVVTDPAKLEAEDTDTGRLARAGARAVIWCLARPGAHAAAWAHVKTMLPPGRGEVLTEGNSVVPALAPDLLMMVMSPKLPREKWKTDAWTLARRADVVIVNPHECGAQEVGGLVAEVARELGGRTPVVADVSRPLEEWADGSISRMVFQTLAAPEERVVSRS